MRGEWPKENAVTVNLDGMSVSELRELKSKIDGAIMKRLEADKAAALAKIREVAAQSGFTLDELVKSPRGARSVVTVEKSDNRSTVEPKYAHPENPSVTWTGRGKAPKWVVDYEAGGKNRNDLLISQV